ncbi:peptidoglycan-binding domain-containing protein [Mameliella alba]|uniref:Peptidoglycan-binding protein n=2 Tax=Mameliella alba TaxID=561184 RepID=A0A0B3SS98_9RHOB|nr:peptidoglycan-binding domain-containing protein [Mameliella alba]KHQ53354.1 Peptidoglycan-binding protein [Mameliella alba]
MRTAGLALAGFLAAAPAWAEFTTGDALVIGNARYGETVTAFGPDAVQAVARALRLRGQEVEQLANGGAVAMQQALDGFVAAIDEGETPLIVVLSGQFASVDGGPVLRPAGRETSKAAGLSLAAVLEVLAQSPRRAFLVLGEAGEATALEALEIPEGVTVIRGPAAKVAEFAAREMAQPALPLEKSADWYGLALSGHASDGLAVLTHTEVRPPSEAEQAAARDRIALLDETAWQRAVESGAFQAYLDSYPQGLHAEAALQMRDGAPAISPAKAEASLALDATARREIQRSLTQLGHRTGGIDGIFGPGTRGAITAWQRQSGTDPTGYLDAAQVARLAKEAAQSPAPSAPRPRRASNAVSAQEAATWNMARGERGLRAYLGQYPNGAFAARARVKLSNMQRGSGQ